MIFLFSLGSLSEVKSQQGLAVHHPDTLISNRKGNNSFDSLPRIRVDTMQPDGKAKGLVIRSICKGYRYVYPLSPVIEMPDERLSKEKVALIYQSTKIKHTPLLKVTGNILYDVNYRSRIDTPYSENSIYQHTLQTRLDFVYKDRYPFKIYLTSRFSNSSLFRKYTDLNFQYTQSDFARLLKNRILGAVASYVASRTGQLDSVKRAMEEKRAAITALHLSAQKPDVAQRLVEEREKELYGYRKKEPLIETDWNISHMQDKFASQRKYKFSAADKKDTATGISVNNNGVKGKGTLYTTKSNMESDKRKLDSMLTQLEKLEKIYKNLSSVQQFKQHEWEKEIEQAKNASELTQILQHLHMPDSLLPKGYKTLYAIQSLPEFCSHNRLPVRVQWGGE